MIRCIPDCGIDIITWVDNDDLCRTITTRRTWVSTIGMTIPIIVPLTFLGEAVARGDLETTSGLIGNVRAEC
jgi:hypothetical protein